VYGLTGILPHVEAPDAPLVLRQLAEPEPFVEPAPQAASGTGSWSRSRIRSPVRAHLVSIDEGMALASGAVFDRRGRFQPLASHDHDFVDHPRRRRRGFVPEPHRFFPDVKRLRGDVVVLTTSSQDFYFHWLFDVLPRLEMAEQAGFAAGPFYVATGLPFQRESLRILGVSETDRIVRAGAGPITASRLIVPCHHIMPGRVFPTWSIEFLRTRFLAGVDAGRRTPARLYVSREGAGHRRVSNEAELIGVLSGYGFEPVRLDGLDLSDQVALFRDARIVVAPHGSGLANLVFCEPGAQVIELFPAGSIDLYYRLSKPLGLDYSFVKSREGPGEAMGSADYRIDPHDVIAALEAVGATR
jgi:capsular polysaccharide biosynthesis protein